MFKKVLCVILIVAILPVKAAALSFDLPAAAYAVVSLDTGEIIDCRNVDTPLPMASTTKIMTCILALENLDLNQRVEIQDQWVRVEGSSLGLLPGHRLSVRDLITGMMLRSGNDAANSVAYLVSGSIEKFADLMDQKALQLDMNNTDFATPSGLPSDGHYTTARDMIKLSQYALKNEEFVSICSKSNATIEVSGEHWQVHNTNKLLSDVEGAFGVKTGYTDAAGRCLVSAVQRDGKSFLCVTFHMDDHFTYHKNVYERLYNMNNAELHPFPDYRTMLPVMSGESDRVLVRAEVDPIWFYNRPQIVDVYLPKFVYAGIKAGDIVGHLTYKLPYNEEFTVPLTAAANITMAKPMSWLDKLIDFLKR